MRAKLAATIVMLCLLAPAGAGAEPPVLAPPFDDQREISWCGEHVAATCELSHAVALDGSFDTDLSSTPWEPAGFGGGGAAAFGWLSIGDTVVEETDVVAYRVRVLVEEAEAIVTGPTAEHARVHPGAFASAIVGVNLEFDGCQCFIEGEQVVVVAARATGPHRDLLLPDLGPSTRRDEILELAVRMVPEDEGYVIPPGRVTLTVSMTSWETIAGYLFGVNGLSVPALDAGRAQARVRARVLDVVRSA